jgi:hypothetical protein
LSYSCFQTSQTGGQWYSDTSPFSIPWTRTILTALHCLLSWQQVQYVKDLMPEHSGGTLVTCIAITSGIGRIIFGKVADHPNVNGIALQQLSFISIGICTMLLTAAPYFQVNLKLG